MKNNRYLPFWILTISIFIGLIVPILIQDGMFIDGILYTGVSKNLANNIGTFWNPIFSTTWDKAGLNSFHEHPPLVFEIQSVFFRIFGNSIYVERFYSFLTACITAYLISLMWKLMNRNNRELRKLSWLPILLWIIIPVSFWSYQNNVQENTMGIFTLLSVYFSLKGLYTNRKIYLNLILGGIFIFLASFSKGIPGLFPIVVIILYWLINRNISFYKMCIYTFILIIVPVIIYSLLLINNEAYESLSFYVTERLLGRIASKPTVDNRFYIVYSLFMELLPVIIITFIMLFVYKFKSIKQKIENSDKRKILLLIFIGLSGSLPLMLTLVQRRFYFAHSLPFFAVGFSLIIAPGLNNLINRIKTERTSFKSFKIITVIIFVSIMAFSVLQIGKTGRNQDQLYDIYLIGKIIPHNSTINIDNSLWNDWSLQCYLIRNFNISVDPSKNHHNFYLKQKTKDNIPIEKYQKVQLSTKHYNLYRLIKDEKHSY